MTSLSLGLIKLHRGSPDQTTHLSMLGIAQPDKGSLLSLCSKAGWSANKAEPGPEVEVLGGDLV